MRDKTTLRDIGVTPADSLGSRVVSMKESAGSGRHKSWQERYDVGLQSPEERRALWRDFDSGWFIASQLVTATLTWGGIGWLADRWLDLAPLLMSFGFVLGFGTGFYLLWARSTGRLDRGTARTDLQYHPFKGPDA